jgi:phosphatidate cytidylyltransferase
MKQRLITGTCYVLVLLGFFGLKIFLPSIWGTVAFDALIYLFTLFGTAEMLRALGERTTLAERMLVLLFAALFLPAFDVGVYLFRLSDFFIIGAGVMIISILLIALLVLRHEETSLESVGCSLLACAYPVLLLSGMALCNHLYKYSDLAILFIFVISPCADSIAYVFGMALGKKLPKKMSPVISPKKTVIGGIGGIFGGVLGAVALFFIYNAVKGSFNFLQLPFYVLLGVAAAVATEFGDLVESAVKRKAGIKDMGNILPGHGGILDRIDGSIYAALVVYIAAYIWFYI